MWRPRPLSGGPIAAVRDGDLVVIDVKARALRLELPAEEIAARLGTWKPPVPRYASGVFAKYAALVTSAAEGAITVPPPTFNPKEQ